MRIRIGTRGSKLALIQADHVRSSLAAAGIETEIVTRTTHGDRERSGPIYRMSRVGIFVDELNSMILSGECDVAVHSAKDMPSSIDDDLEVSAVLPRASFRDVLVSDRNLSELRKGAVIGTSSMRRIAELRAVRNDLEVRDIRGNIDTRIEKFMSGEYDGIILAEAALERMGTDVGYFPLDVEDFLPAANQGIISVVSRKGSEISHAMKNVNDEETMNCFRLERELVTGLRLGCSMPAGILCTSYENLYHIYARFYSINSEEFRSFETDVKHLEDARKMVKEIVGSLPERFGYGFGV